MTPDDLQRSFVKLRSYRQSPHFQARLVGGRRGAGDDRRERDSAVRAHDGQRDDPTRLARAEEADPRTR
jgi:hypothetical protein